MTTENRMGSVVSVERTTISFLQLAALARLHGETLVQEGVRPLNVSVAVEEFLISRNPESNVRRNKVSPYDVFLKLGSEYLPIFIDSECHQLMLAIQAYVVGDQQEAP